MPAARHELDHTCSCFRAECDSRTRSRRNYAPSGRPVGRSCSDSSRPLAQTPDAHIRRDCHPERTGGRVPFPECNSLGRIAHRLRSRRRALRCRLVRRCAPDVGSHQDGDFTGRGRVLCLQFLLQRGSGECGAQPAGDHLVWRPCKCRESAGQHGRPCGRGHRNCRGWPGAGLSR